MKTIPLKEVLGINIKYYRFKMGLSQEKFCNLFGYSRPYLNDVERFKRNPTIEWVEQLSFNLDVPILELLKYDETHIIKRKRIDQKKVD